MNALNKFGSFFAYWWVVLFLRHKWLRELEHARGVLYRADQYLCRYWMNTASYRATGRVPVYITEACGLLWESIDDINEQIRQLRDNYWELCRRESTQQRTFH